MKANLLPKLLLITVIDISLFAILIYYIFKNLNKDNLFFKFIIPFNWIQAFQAFKDNATGKYSNIVSVEVGEQTIEEK